MATGPQTLAALLTLEEYLRTSYRPDCDFVDDHLEERAKGETLHSLLQMELGFWFRSHRAEWGLLALPEIRTRVSAKRVRIPDVAVVLEDEALREKVRTTPPLIAIEILSPEDRMPRVLLRLDDFLAMGIAHVWLFDPAERVAYTYTRWGLKLVETPRLALADSQIYVDLPELFSVLDAGK
jgi:Uma2 family endonuclease